MHKHLLVIQDEIRQTSTFENTACSSVLPLYQWFMRCSHGVVPNMDLTPLKEAINF